MPESRDQACSVIGKFTQGGKADGKRLTRRLVTDQGELDYLVHDTRRAGTLVGAPMKCELGHIITYYDGFQPQFTHLRASMLAYAHINVLSMLQRFEPDEAVRVATDSIYVQKSALYKLEGVEAYVAPKRCDYGEVGRMLLGHEDLLVPAQWRDKGEHLYMPMEHAAYLAKPDYKATKKDLTPSTAPCEDDPLSRHRLSYLNGGGGSGKTKRAIEFFRTRNPLVFTPTHRLAKEMRARGVQAQIYNSFFRWSGQTDWTPERMGQKFIPPPLWSYGTRSAPCPAPLWKPYSTGTRVGASRSSAAATRGSRPQSPEKCHTTGSANYYEEVEVDHQPKTPFSRPSKRPSVFSQRRPSAERYERRFPVPSGGSASWRPGSRLISS